MIRTAVLSCLLALTAAAAVAETTVYYREGQRVEPRDVKRILEAAPTAPSGGYRTRSIRVLGDAPATATTTAQAAAPSALSLPVRFDFDSATISPSAREQLDALADGIKLLPPERLVVIEGHTDARGTDDYNQQLSQRRAAAVKQYLVEEHGIAPERLRDTGVGKRQPVPDSDPLAAINRRVQFRGG